MCVCINELHVFILFTCRKHIEVKVPPFISSEYYCSPGLFSHNSQKENFNNNKSTRKKTMKRNELHLKHTFATCLTFHFFRILPLVFVSFRFSFVSIQFENYATYVSLLRTPKNNLVGEGCKKIYKTHTHTHAQLWQSVNGT